MRSKSLLLATLILAVVVAGCTSIGPQPTPVAPTKTPKPTFTPTPDWTPTPVVFATAAPVAAEPTAEAAAPAQPEATAEPAATEAPTAEPTPAEANTVVRLTATQTVNARRGPGTNYPVIGRLSAGQAFPVTGKNARGDWYQFDLDGQPAWVIANLVNVSGDPAPSPGSAEHPGSAHRAPDRAAAAPTDFTAGQPPAQPQPAPQPAAPSYPWALQAGSIRGAPQCGTVHFDGQVQYKNGLRRDEVGRGPRRDVADDELRHATRVGRVHRAHDEPEAVGVDEVLVDPRLRRARQHDRVHLARRDEHLLRRRRRWCSGRRRRRGTRSTGGSTAAARRTARRSFGSHSRTFFSVWRSATTSAAVRLSAAGKLLPFTSLSPNAFRVIAMLRSM